VCNVLEVLKAVRVGSGFVVGSAGTLIMGLPGLLNGAPKNRSGNMGLTTETLKRILKMKSGLLRPQAGPNHRTQAAALVTGIVGP
jgi:hypothetical protein